MSLLLAALSAVTYGGADFAGGLASRYAGATRVALVGQSTGAALTLALALVLGGEPTAAALGWGALGGLANGAGTTFLYRGLAAGRMGLVAPVSGVGTAIVPVAVGLGLGERPGLLVWLGLLAAVPGIWLVASEPSVAAERPGGSGAAGLREGVLAGLGFGLLFVALSRVPEGAGLLPLAVNQGVAGLVVLGVLLGAARAGAHRPPAPEGAGRRALVGGLASGTLAATATACYLLATQGGSLVAVSVVASLFPAATVALATLVLRERLHLPQAGGLALCLAAVALVAAG